MLIGLVLLLQIVVGQISGGEFRVKGQVEFSPAGAATVLSGAEIDVRSGTARLALLSGEARLCGPLKLTVLKGADGDTPLLFALDSTQSGSLELEYSGTESHTFQTPFLAVSNVPGAAGTARHMSLRVSPGGEACIAALAGSVRVREQLTTAEMLIPPGKTMLVPPAGVDKAVPVEASACVCGAPMPASSATASAPASPEPRVETKTTISTAPLVYEAQATAGGAAAGTPSAAREPEVTLPVVVAAPPPEVQAEAPPAPPSVKPSPARRGGFGAALKRFFRAIFGA